MRHLRAVLCGSVVMALASGCSPGATAPPPASSLSAAPATMEVAGTPPPSSALSDAASPRATMPAGFPVYPGSRVQPATAGLLARWSVDADPPAVLAWFLEELPRAGLAITEQLPGGDAAILRLSSADGAPYQLDLAGHDPVQVSLGPPHD